MITDADISNALSAGPDDYCLTTQLYWECDCASDYLRRKEQTYCERCDAFGADCPDADLRILRAAGIHLDYWDPNVRDSLDEHNTGKRTIPLAPTT